jgi:hypothetical protein
LASPSKPICLASEAGQISFSQDYPAAVFRPMHLGKEAVSHPHWFTASEPISQKFSSSQAIVGLAGRPAGFSTFREHGSQPIVAPASCRRP